MCDEPLEVADVIGRYGFELRAGLVGALFGLLLPVHEPHIALYPPFADLLVDGGVANHSEHVGDTSYH